MKAGKFGMITIALVLCITFCGAGTVLSQSVDKEQENMYKQMEKEYVTQVREYLNQTGYENPGIMLTRVIDENGSREYTLTLHHRRFERMTDREKEDLLSQLKQFEFEVEDGGFCQEFLAANL